MKESPDHSGRVSIGLLVCIALICLLPVLLFAGGPAYPSWWTDWGVIQSGSAIASGTNDYAAVNQGQVKNIAVAAVNELNAHFAGGAGQTLNNLAGSWGTIQNGTFVETVGTNTNDYAPVNIGQLKALAQPFYDQLILQHFATQYPWASATNAPNDYAMANIGQVKNLFSFDVAASTTSTGLPDWWQSYYFGSGTSAWLSGTALAPNGDGLTMLQNYQQGINPVDYYNGQRVDLSVVSGNNQVGALTGMLPYPMVVAVTDLHGNLLVNAPVTFSTSIDGILQASDTISGTTVGSFAQHITVTTDSSGYARAYIYFVAPRAGTYSITASTFTTGPSSAFTFRESVSDTPPSSPPPPVITPPPNHDPGAGQQSNITSVVNLDGSLDISWTNTTIGTSNIVIKLKKGDGTWITGTSVPPDTTSVHIPPQ